MAELVGRSIVVSPSLAWAIAAAVLEAGLLAGAFVLAPASRDYLWIVLAAAIAIAVVMGMVCMTRYFWLERPTARLGIRNPRSQWRINGYRWHWSAMGLRRAAGPHKNAVIEQLDRLTGNNVLGKISPHELESFCRSASRRGRVWMAFGTAFLIPVFVFSYFVQLSEDLLGYLVLLALLSLISVPGWLMFGAFIQDPWLRFYQKFMPAIKR